MNGLTDLSEQINFLMYSADNENVSVNVLVKDENIWLTQKAMAELFNVDTSGISRHIKNIFAEGELEEKSNLQFLQFANSDKPVAVYSLDVIISVGYRVNSRRATQFRIWSTKVLKEYMQKGFALDDERLKLSRRTHFEIRCHRCQKLSVRKRDTPFGTCRKRL